MAVRFKMPNRRRGSIFEIGILLLLLDMFSIGFLALPPITLMTVLGQLLIYIGAIEFPWDQSATCLSACCVLQKHDFKTLILAPLEHVDDIHLYFNMISFTIKGRCLERQYGSLNFGILLSLLTIATSVIYVFLSKILSDAFLDDHFMKACAYGFSGVIFALKVITTKEARPFTQTIGGFTISSRYAAWIELILIHILVPKASFISHVSGILAGLLYAKSPIGQKIDQMISTVTGTKLVHCEWWNKAHFDCERNAHSHSHSHSHSIFS